MTSTPATTPPNHHATHPGFSGFGGLMLGVAFLFGRERAARLAIELADLKAGDRLVDIGCGPGVAARRAAALGATVVGVDPASVMLRVARARWRRGSVDWRIGSAEQLPVDDGWADVVWSLATVHHWQDVDAALAEVRRVLRPGGRLVVAERRVRDITADGVDSHGWIPEQAESFAALCRTHGFTAVTVTEHDAAPVVLSVVAHR